MSKFEVLLVFGFVFLFSAASGLIHRTLPHRRYYEERTRLPDCFSSASRTCYEPVINEYGDDPLETLRSTDLREICALEMDALICLGRHVRSDCSDEDIAMIRDSESYSYVTQYVMAVSLACYQYNDVISEYKSCLLRTDGEELEIGPPVRECMPTPSEEVEDHCSLSSYLDCISSAATPQCGQEIGTAIADIAVKVQEACDYVEEGEIQKRGFFEFMRNSVWNRIFPHRASITARINTA